MSPHDRETSLVKGVQSQLVQSVTYFC